MRYKNFVTAGAAQKMLKPSTLNIWKLNLCYIIDKRIAFNSNNLDLRLSDMACQALQYCMWKYICCISKYIYGLKLYMCTKNIFVDKKNICGLKNIFVY